MKTNKTAQLACPKCGNYQSEEVPQDSCQAFYKCDSCKEVISVPEENDACCVICAFSDTTCPMKD